MVSSSHQYFLRGTGKHSSFRVSKEERMKTPKNGACVVKVDTCRISKMTKSKSRAKGGNKSIKQSRPLQYQNETARKLTQRLKGASVEGKFSKDEILVALRRLGELKESVELLKQSGCGKAVGNVRKYFFGGHVKHYDRDVSTAASALRSRWMSTLGRGFPASGTMADSKAAGSSSPGASSTGTASSFDEGCNKKTDDVPSDDAAVRSDTPAKSVELSEPRRKAMAMLMSVLGSSTAAVDRCSAIEEEFFSTQGREVGREYLRCLRNAVFSMEGPEGRRLRQKVMSEMVLPRDFVSKSSDELRAFASML